MRNPFLSPVALLLYAAGCAVVPVVALPGAWQALEAGRATELTHVEGQLRGPHGMRRSVNDEWDLVDVDGAVDTFTAGGRDADVLSRSRAAVTAGLHEGEVVDVTTAQGETVRSLDVGARGAVSDLCYALLGVAGAFGFARYAARKRRSVSAEPVDTPTLVLLLPPLLAGAGMGFGLSWPVAVSVAAACTLLVAFGARR